MSSETSQNRVFIFISTVSHQLQPVACFLAPWTSCFIILAWFLCPLSRKIGNMFSLFFFFACKGGRHHPQRNVAPHQHPHPPCSRLNWVAIESPPPPVFCVFLFGHTRFQVLISTGWNCWRQQESGVDLVRLAGAQTLNLTQQLVERAQCIFSETCFSSMWRGRPGPKPAAKHRLDLPKGADVLWGSSFPRRPTSGFSRRPSAWKSSRPFCFCSFPPNFVQVEDRLVQKGKTANVANVAARWSSKVT